VRTFLLETKDKREYTMLIMACRWWRAAGAVRRLNGAGDAQERAVREYLQKYVSGGVLQA